VEQKREEMRKKKKKKKFKAGLAKLIPIAVAVVLIIAIGVIYYGKEIVENVYYSSETKDLNEFYEIFSPDDVAVFVQNSYIPNKGKLINGTCYFNMNTVQELFTDRFYINMEEGIVLYTTQTDIYKTLIGEEFSSYYISGQEKSLEASAAVLYEENVYISAEYLQLFAPFTYELYLEPNRVLIYNQWASRNVSLIDKDTNLRTHGGVKSPIVVPVAEGDSVYILEPMEKWTKVLTKTGFMGYVENRYLEDAGSEAMAEAPAVVEDGYTSIAKDYKINMAFHQVFSANANSTFEEYTKNTQAINVIAPTWFRLEENGSFGSIASKDYVEKAHAKGMEVWAVFTDVDKNVDLEAIFSTEAGREFTISQMMNYVNEYNLDGINIDFETVKAPGGDDFVQFLRELSIQTHAAGVVLSVDNYAPTASTEHYNRKEQGLVADYVLIMGYDEHWGGSDVAGSVASIDFVEAGIQNTIAQGVPANKIINAIPFYTRLWKIQGGVVSSEALGMDKAENWVKNNGVEAVWDNLTCQYYAEKQTDTTTYQIWLEEEESIQTKLNVMNANGVAGVAEWKLGFERPEIWTVIQAYVNS